MSDTFLQQIICFIYSSLFCHAHTYFDFFSFDILSTTIIIFITGCLESENLCWPDGCNIIKSTDRHICNLTRSLWATKSIKIPNTCSTGLYFSPIPFPGACDVSEVIAKYTLVNLQSSFVTQSLSKPK